MRARAGLVVALAAFGVRCSSFDAEGSGAPPNDAGPVDASSDAGPVDASSEASGPCLFCDDFEAATIDVTRWTPSGEPNVFDLDSTGPKSGKQSLHMKLPESPKEGHLVGHVAANGKGLWTTYMRLPVNQLASGQAPVGLLSVGYGNIHSKGSDPHGLAELELTSAGLKVYIQGNNGVSDAPSPRLTDFAANTWLKVVFDFDFHANLVKVTVDGKTAASLVRSDYDFATPSVLDGGMDVRIGRAGDGPAIEAWFDDTSFQ